MHAACSVKACNDDIKLEYYFPSDATVGLEYTNYMVLEEDGGVEVCITLSTGCFVDFEFSVEVSTFSYSVGSRGR